LRPASLDGKNQRVRWQLKIIASLPDGKHFRPVDSLIPGKWVWRDKASPLLQVVAPVANPWDREWPIFVSVKIGRSDMAEYPRRLDLICQTQRSPEHLAAKIVRERSKGKLAYTLAPALFFAAIPCPGEINWLLVSIYRREP